MTVEKWNARTEMLIGSEGTEKLRNAHVLIAGLGGVGASAAEMLGRAGVGMITLADADVVMPSNRNRQLCALKSTEKLKKTSVVTARLTDINPEMTIYQYNNYLIDDTIHEVLDKPYDFVVDAIDTLSPKVFFIYHCLQKGFPLVSAMGAGGKIDPSMVQIGDISDTYNCKLARYVRKKLHKLGVNDGFMTVFSPETIDKDRVEIEKSKNKKAVTGTISYMPTVFGCFAASVVIRRLVGEL